MTNEQTAALLRHIVARLASALEEVDVQIPEPTPRKRVKHYVGDYDELRWLDNDPSSWEYRDDGPAMILEPIRSVIEDIESDIESLKGETET